ncbi:cytochrome P450 [Auricularia subglabra TFB-10046 SS5]|uniref:Cytochrome P450 n=1 Tax=Auricularia subglabra (strain TFB-10046 / SS5) TaxID=717982 RepID=J0CZJ3_AURST|nr:cytochrome P450 [Auricularia subglabra TFB-10046 SS5]
MRRRDYHRGASRRVTTGHHSSARLTCAQITALPVSITNFHVVDPTAIKEITLSRSRFPKPTKVYELLSLFGENIVATEGDKWKRHRKPVAPAFSERNNRLVWEETTSIVLNMFKSSAWRGKDEVAVDHIIDITLPIALFVISVAGFGRAVSWDDDDSLPAGHTMTFKQAMGIVSQNMATRAMLPDWVMSLRHSWRQAKTAYKEMRLYMEEMIKARNTAEAKETRYDLFSGLLADGGELSDQELMGNVYIFLVAGHETTAHTLAFTFGLLAIYQDIQDRLFEHIQSLTTEGTVPEYEDMPKFTYALAVFYETLRMYTPIPIVAKYSVEDTTLNTVRIRPDGQYEPATVFVPKDSTVSLDLAGVHYNPRFWKDPYKFCPERFMEPDWPRDAFVPFSAGARACIGRRFFETEGIAILITLVRHYKITVKDEPQFRGLDQEQLREKLLRARPIITVTPYHVPLVFTRRD